MCSAALVLIQTSQQLLDVLARKCGSDVRDPKRTKPANICDHQTFPLFSHQVDAGFEHLLDGL